MIIFFNKMYRRIFVIIVQIILIFLLVAGMTACSGKKQDQEQSRPEESQKVELKENPDSVSLPVESETEQPDAETISEESEENINADISEDDDSTVSDQTMEDFTGLSEAELWNKYREAKDNLEAHRAANDYPAQIEDLKITARCANLLNKPDIEAWQFNNMGYFTILEFKRLAEYHERINRIETMKGGKAKTEFTNETRQRFADYFYLLESAERYLNKAKRIDKNLNDMNRTKMILNNKKFVDSIKRFIEQ